MAKQQRRQRYRDEGRCVSCGGEKDRPEITTCAKCRDRNAQRIEARKAKGLCIKCGKAPSMDGETACEPCKHIRSLKFRERYYDAVEQGKCPHCCGVPLKGQQFCAGYLDAKKRFNQCLKDKAFEAYGGYECACCYETEKLFLQIDHVNGDGYKHRREQGLGNNLYQWLKKHGYPQGFQVLCANCNWARGRRDNPSGICPHQIGTVRPNQAAQPLSELSRAA